MYKRSPSQKNWKKLYKKNYSTHKQSFLGRHDTWKLSVLVGLTITLVTVIFLPALIVMLPGKQGQEVASVEVSSDAQQTSKELELSSFDVEVKRKESGDIEKVPLEDYVTSVVASEMPAEFEGEALKAQAIAARTYVVNHLLHADEEDNQVISDQTVDQVYLNKEELKQNWGKEYQWKMDKVSEAVNDTKNIIITYDEEPITPTFFSMSNGYTEDAENYWGNKLPYLKSVESKWEEKNPNFAEQKIFNIDELENKIGVTLEKGSQIPVEISRTSSQRVDKININGTGFSGKELREKLGLRSNDFTVKQKDDHFIFTTKGFGHGVGMSQYGANGMAEEGKNYKEILQYYYQGVELQNIKEAAPALVAK